MHWYYNETRARTILLRRFRLENYRSTPDLKTLKRLKFKDTGSVNPTITPPLAVSITISDQYSIQVRKSCLQVLRCVTTCRSVV